MNDLLVSFICAHLVGDFILQNHWMATNKSSSTWACVYHVMCYSLPFSLGLAFKLITDIPAWVFFLIMVQHYLQDRYQLHLKWTKFYRQSSPEQWPAGPLFYDQAWHIFFLWIFASLPF